MKPARLAAIVFAPPIGFAVYALASHVALLAGWALPESLLPVAFALGCGLGWALAARVPPVAIPSSADPDARVWKLVPWLVALFLVVLLGTVAYGAVATTDREWDGLVSWTLRAHYLAPPADLTRPFFCDPAIYAHSLPYPLLQPLCLGGCQALLGDLSGRLFFPAVFLAFLGLVAGVAHDRGLSRGHAWLMVLAFGATPMWYSTGSGAVDSGYADLLLAYFLAVAAAGLITQRAILVVSAAFCLPLIKPEGLPYALFLAVVTAIGSASGSAGGAVRGNDERSRRDAGGRRWRGRLHNAATVGLVLSTALWLPLQTRLLGRSAGPLTWALPLGLGIGLWGLAAVQIRAVLRVRTWLLIGLGGAVLVALLLTRVGTTRWAHSPLLLEFAGSLAELPGRLVDLPVVLWGYLEGLLFIRKFGLLFPMLLCLLCFRRSWTTGSPHRAATGFFLGGIVIACAAIFLGANDDWDHVFKSRFDRLLLHWVGVGWLVLGPWLSELYRDPVRLESRRDAEPAPNAPGAASRRFR